MAELIFKAASAKDTENLPTDRETAADNGVTLDEKKGVVLVDATSTLEANSTIDVSGSAYFKTVSVASGYANAVEIQGNGLIANEFRAGDGGSTMFGGSGGLNDKDKFTTAADKFYGGEGTDYFVYEANAGKDTFFNYKSFGESEGEEEAATGSNDVILIQGLTETQSLSFVDKNGGLTITISDSNSEKEVAAGLKAGDTAKNSVLTIDGKTAAAAGGFILTDGTNETVYGVMPNDVGFGVKSSKTDTSTLTIGGAAEGDINVNIISSAVKNIVAENEGEVYITGNGNANSITIGAGGGTIDPGYGAKATADKVFGTASAPVTYVFDAVNGGKDTFGDAKLTQYNYKAGDTIVLMNSDLTEDDIAAADQTILSAKSGDIILNIDKNNSLTLKNAVGKPINISTAEYNTETGEFDLTPIAENWGDTLPTGLVYDSKLSKISADAAAFESLPKTGTKTVFVETGTFVTLNSGEVKPLGYEDTVGIYETITLGAESAASFVGTSVKTIDMSESEAPVLIDTSADAYVSVNAISTGDQGGTIVGNVAVDGVDNKGNEATFIINQTFTAGKEADLFQINAADKLDATEIKSGKRSYKADVINGIGAGDSVSIDAAIADISFAEKGKDLNIDLYDSETGLSYTVVTVKNFDSDTALTIVGDGGSKTALTPLPTGLKYATKSGKVDKTGLVASGTLAASVVSAADYGDTTIKNIDASGVTAATGSKLSLAGGSAANNIYAPAAKIATTLNGGAGNDNLTAGGGKTTYIFQAQEKGKKDVISGFKSGEVIVIDQGLLADSLQGDFELNDDGFGVINANDGKGNTTISGFNDSKSDVVITINKSNTLTVKEGAGKQIILSDGEGGATYSFGHVLPSGLAFDSKNTAVTLSGSKYTGNVNLSDTNIYYGTIKTVSLVGNSGVANIYGNTLANDFYAGKGGGILDGGDISDAFAENNKLKPTADKLTGGDGKDTYVYDIGYGKDSFLSYGEGDVVSLGAEITADMLSIVDKKNVLSVSIVDYDWADPKDTLEGFKTAANSTFSITKTSDNVAVTFVGEGLATGTATIGSFVYGSMPSGVSMDEKYTTISVSTDAAATVDASVINSQPKTIDARSSADTSGLVLIGNANADAIYGGAGSNTLFGGTAGTKAVKDALYGGAGNDVFVFSTQDGEKGKETDIINNYQAGDIIVLDREPTLIKADGKAVTLTFKDPDPVKEDKTVDSTLVINGAAQDDTMKKFGVIDKSVTLTFAIGDIYNEDTGAFDLSAALKNTETYVFDGTLKDSSLKGGKLEWSSIGEDTGVTIGSGSDEEELEQYAATDGWFEEIVSTDNASVSELDSILDAKGALNGDLAQLDGDAFFTNTSFESKAAAVTGARHQAKK